MSRPQFEHLLCTCHVKPLGIKAEPWMHSERCQIFRDYAEQVLAEERRWELRAAQMEEEAAYG